MWQLTPVERIYLFFIAAIIASQLPRDSWDPAAVGAIGIFIGLIPAGRLDRQKQRERKQAKEVESTEPVIDPTLAQEGRDAIRKYLEETEE